MGKEEDFEALMILLGTSSFFRWILAVSVIFWLLLETYEDYD